MMTNYQTIADALGMSLHELAENSYTASPAEQEQIRQSSSPYANPAACAVLDEISNLEQIERIVRAANLPGEELALIHRFLAEAHGRLYDAWGL